MVLIGERSAIRTVEDAADAADRVEVAEAAEAVMTGLVAEVADLTDRVAAVVTDTENLPHPKSVDLKAKHHRRN